MNTSLAILCLAAALAAEDAAPAPKPEPSPPAQPAAPAEAPKAAPTTDPKAEPKPYPLKTCIVSDNDLDSMGEQTSIIHEGRVIKFCCEPCVAKFRKNPAKYLRKLEGK